MERNVSSHWRLSLASLVVLFLTLLSASEVEAVSADLSQYVLPTTKSLTLTSSGRSYTTYQFTASVADVVYSPDNGDDTTPTTIPANQSFSISFAGPLYTFVNQLALNNIKVDDEYMAGCVQLVNTDDGVVVACTVAITSWTETETTISVTPDAELISEKHYSLIVFDDMLQYGVRNLLPLGNGDFVYDVYAQNDYVIEDTNKPMLDETRDDGAWQDGYYVGSGETILSNDTLKLDFVEPVQAGTGSIKIYTWNGNLVATIDASTLTTDPNDNSIVYVSLVSGLEVGESYYVIVEPGAITDLAGNIFDGVDEEDDWSFTVVADEVPDIVSYTPVGSNIALGTDLMIEFDLAVELGSGKINIYLTDGTLVQSLDVVTDAMYFTMVGNKVYIDINELTADTEYMVSVDAGAFVSSAGEPAAAISTSDWQFQTETNQAPLLVDLTPDDDSVDVPLNQQFIMEFNMDVQAGNGLFELHKADGMNTLVASFYANDSQVSISGSTVTIDLSAYLEEGTEYYIIVYPDFVKNTSVTPESYAGLLKVFNWNFTTVSDTIAPEVLVLSPDETTISDNHPTFVMTFDEAVQLSSTGGNIYVYQEGSTTPILTIALTAGMFSNNEVTISYVYDGTNGLAINTNYYVLVDAGAIEDTNGNDYAGISSNTEWTFTTGTDYALGIGDDLSSSDLLVYPNPFSDVLYLSGADKIDRVIFTNVLGQQVKEVVEPSEALSTSDLRNGIYIVSLMLDNVVVNTQRIIKR